MLLLLVSFQISVKFLCIDAFLPLDAVTSLNYTVPKVAAYSFLLGSYVKGAFPLKVQYVNSDKSIVDPVLVAAPTGASGGK